MRPDKNLTHLSLEINVLKELEAQRKKAFWLRCVGKAHVASAMLAG